MDDMTPSAANPHLATISHDGRFWDVYLEFEDDAGRSASHRGRLRFAPADGDGDDGVRTATIIIENSDEAVIGKAREMADHMLVALLRSALPD